MWNRIDASLSEADVQDIQNAFEAIKSKIDFNKALTDGERRKGGWYLSQKALLLLDEELRSAKNDPANFPKLKVAEFERDINLIKQLAFLETQVLALQFLMKDTRRILTKDATEQGSYVYATLKVFHDIGILGGESFKRLQEYMPRSGKRSKTKKEKP
jgi:hypothetical protein